MTAVRPGAATGAEVNTRMYWGVIIGGVLLSLAAIVTLSALFTAIGFAVAAPTEPGEIAIGTGVLTIVAIAGGIFIGTWLATSLMAGPSTRRDNAVRGLVIWALSFLVLLYLTGTGILGVGAAVLETVQPALMEVAPAEVDPAVAAGAALWLFLLAIIAAIGGYVGGMLGTPAAYTERRREAAPAERPAVEHRGEVGPAPGPA